MNIAHIQQQRVGEGVSPEFCRPMADLIASLDATTLTGEAALERDCLSFMLEGWPTYETEQAAEFCFQSSDILLQIGDVRAQPAAALLSPLLAEIEHHIRNTGPVIQ